MASYSLPDTEYTIRLGLFAGGHCVSQNSAVYRRRCLTILACTAAIPWPGTVHPHRDTADQNELPSRFEARWKL